MPLARLLLATVAVIASAVPALAQTGDGWSMVGGDPSHRGEAPGPAPPYRELWRAETPDLRAGLGSLALTKEALAAVSLEEIEAEELETNVQEVTREDGPTGPPAIVVGEFLETTTGVAYATGGGAEAAVAFHEEVGLGGFGPNDLPSEPAWETPIGAPAVGGLTGVTSENDPLVLAGTRQGFLHALSADDGSRAWRFKADGILEGAPAVAGDNAIVVSQNMTNGITTVYAVDLATGEEAWRYSPPGVTITASSATVAGDTIVVGFGDLTVRGLDAGTGRLRWETRTRAGFSPRMVPIAPDDVYIGDLFGHLYRLDPRTGQERWVHRVPGPLTFGSPVSVGDHVVVGDRSGQISAIDTDTGHLVWKHDTGDNDVVGLAPDDDELYASIANDGIVAFTHDPAGTLLDEPSPTTLFVRPALLNYAITAVPLYLLLLLLFRMRRTRKDGAPAITDGAGPPAGWRES